MLRTGLLVLVVLAAMAWPAAAQEPPGGCKVWQTNSEQSFTITSTKHYRLIQNVEINCNDMQFFADEVEIFSDADRMRASGHVVFVSNENRISAERMEFNTRTRTGTFFIASGIASLAGRTSVDRSLFGTQEPDAYFWGESIEKLGPKTYRITHGGFTTCVQPTPRWELVSDSVKLTLEEHAILKNAILKVKGVPLFYLPVMYYPINKEDRATGFLIPTYGASTIRGQTLSNAFFWAINRSQDATFYHDLYSKTGQGFGSEYRYIEGPGAAGNVHFQVIDEHDAVYQQADGSESLHPASSSYSFGGNMAQPLPGHMRFTANTDYFSSVSAQQRYEQGLYQLTSSTRRYNANLTGAWGRYSLSTTVDRTQTFSTENVWSLYGSTPRVTVTRAEAPIGKLPLYFGAFGEFVTLSRSDESANVETDRGLTRFDAYPSLRFPFTRWSFLTFNSSVLWRATYWTESLDPLQGNAQVPEPIGRTYLDMSTRITGPVFTRIFNTPRMSFAQKFKHVIEPTFTIQRVTAINNYDQIVKIDGTDTVPGQVTRFVYGLNNRLYAKRDTAREILSVSVSQSYYTDANAARVDTNYQSGYNQGLPPSHYSPVVVLVHGSPSQRFEASFRTEYDTQVHALRTLAANGTWNSGRWVFVTAGWSQRRFIPDLPTYNNPLSATHYLNAATNVRSPGNSVGGIYTFNYDFLNNHFLQQRYMAYYNSQCCGFSVEYQTVNYGAAIFAVGVPQDHRLNISFTLAGIGTFSNLLGAFGGQTTR
jgi:LPS-assembly protein